MRILTVITHARFFMAKTEISYGVIPLRKKKGQWNVLMVQHDKGHWAFPKGHSEADEQPHVTAERELLEETGLRVLFFMEMPPLKEEYFFYQGSDLIHKKVIYFAGCVKGSVVLQESEILDYQWLSLEQAKQLATFKKTRELCDQLIYHLPALKKC
jgi:bis(5'-nucleosidyl)-tetraphosphatase